MFMQRAKQRVHSLTRENGKGASFVQVYPTESEITSIVASPFADRELRTDGDRIYFAK